MLGRIPQSRLYTPGPQHPEHLPRRRTSPRAAASTSRARIPNERAAPRGPAPPGLPGHGQVALHRPLHEHQGRDHCRPTARPGPATAATSSRCPSLFEHPGKNYMLSATGILSPSMSLEVSVGRAQNSLNYELQQREPLPLGGGPLRAAAALPRRRPGGLHPLVRFPQRRPRAATPASTRPTAVRSRTRTRPTDVLANLSKIWGSPLDQVRRLLPAQLQAAEHLRGLQQPDQFQRRREQPVRHRLRLRQRRHRRLQPATSRPTSTRCRSGSTRTSSGTGRTTGRSAGSSRSTTACASTT